MIQIPISATANQSLSIRLDEQQWDIVLNEGNGCMAATISRAGETLVQGQRIVAGTPLLPYPRIVSGNFLLTTENDELPSWELFGVTQFLFYATESDLA